MKAVLVLSDMHCGHRLAIMPPSFETSDGIVVKANKPQRALYKFWLEVVKKWKNPDVLVVNGEPFDGQQPIDRGTEAWTTNYLDQVDASVQLIKEFGAKKIFTTRGSNYHVSIGGISIEEIFAERVGAEKVDGKLVFPELFLDVENVKFNFAHHISSSVSGWQYRSTPSAKEAMLLKLNESHKWPYDILVRSHVHYYWYNGSTSHLAMTTPCWQLQTWFMYRKTAAGTIPDIGAVRFIVDNESYDWDEMIAKNPTWKPTRVRA